MRDPVPSWVIVITPLCPAMRPVGLASVLFPASVTEKLFAAEKSGVMVAPSVSAEMLDAEFPET